MKSIPILLLLLVFAIAAACAAPAFSAAQSVPLMLKFTPGETLQYDVTFSGSGNVTAPGADLAVLGLRGNLTVVQKVVEVLPDGSGRLETTIPRLEVDVTLADHQARFSFVGGRMRLMADGKESSPPDTASLQNIPLLMTPITFTVAPDGRTTGISLADQQLLGQLSQVIPQLDAAQMWRSSEPLFPSSPVAVGETWRRSARYLPFGPQMPIIATISHTLDEYTEKEGMGLARISGFADASLAGSQQLNAPGGVSVAIPELRETITSTEFFNTTKGQLVRGDYDVSLRTRFAVQAAEQSQSGRLEARLRVSVQAR